jgi:hypothetical protein
MSDRDNDRQSHPFRPTVMDDGCYIRTTVSAVYQVKRYHASSEIPMLLTPRWLNRTYDYFNIFNIVWKGHRRSPQGLRARDDKRV